MYGRNDPRFRRTINQLTQNLESANESAQVGLFSFSENYLKPCFASISDCVDPCLPTSTPKTPERARRYQRHRFARGRPEASFDFYDDWEEEENAALLGLAAGETSDGRVDPQRRHATMTYGSQGPLKPTFGQRRNGVMPYDTGPDPTIIPNQSYFGFLNKLPFKFGSRVLRYKPSAAGLQERPKDKAGETSEEGAYADLREGRSVPTQKHRRNRSATQDSRHTADSLSSRGDIFPSDEEADAVPLEDDDFTTVLERRPTGASADDRKSSKAKVGEQRKSTQRPTTSRVVSYTNISSDRLMDATPSVHIEPAHLFSSNMNDSSLNMMKDAESSVSAQEDIPGSTSDTVNSLVESTIELEDSPHPHQHVQGPSTPVVKSHQDIG